VDGDQTRKPYYSISYVVYLLRAVNSNCMTQLYFYGSIQLYRGCL